MVGLGKEARTGGRVCVPVPAFAVWSAPGLLGPYCTTFCRDRRLADDVKE